MFRAFILLIISGLVTASLQATAPDRLTIATADRDSAKDAWRRTRLGWQRKSEWQLDSQAPPPPAAGVHPLVVAALQVLIAGGALLAGTGPARK